MPLPTYTPEEAGDYIAAGHWVAFDGSTHEYLSFDVSSGDTLNVNLSDLNATERVLAEAALESWSTVTGIIFNEVSNFSDADIDFSNSGGFGAAAGPTSFTNAGEIVDAVVQIGTSWTNYFGGEVGDYSFQTYIHEIGHALGLGHAGDYDGSANFDTDAVFANDSWQMSVMSYFATSDNDNVTGDLAYVVTPMIADIEAMKILYGLNPEVHEGNTVWGANSNVGGYLQDLFEDFAAGELDYAIALTIQDTGGIDTIDLNTVTENQVIDLREAAISSVGGVTGNLVIAYDTVIENVIGGSGKDTITGNAADNNLKGEAGKDTISGGNGRDTLNGGDGADTLKGENGADTLNGGSGADTLNGGGGDDKHNGGSGRDTINGGGGNDTINGGDGDDTLNGGGGADTINGGDGDDAVNGGGSGDTLNGDDGDDTLNGGAGADTLNGSIGDDTTNGGAGSDTVNGGSGSDTINGGAGGDTLNGGSDGDALNGGAGGDTLNGGAGADIINGGAGADTLTGGNGSDEFVFNNNFGADVIEDFNTSVDTLTLNDAIWGNGLDAADVIETYGDIVEGIAELDFGSSGSITFTGLTSLDDLESTITIV